MSDDTIPDHYVTLDCPDCNDFRLHTARRSVGEFGTFCYQCGTELDEADVVDWNGNR